MVGDGVREDCELELPGPRKLFGGAEVFIDKERGEGLARAGIFR